MFIIHSNYVHNSHLKNLHISHFIVATHSEVPSENAANEPDLGLTILNPVVPLAPINPTSINTSIPETTAQ